MSASEGSRLAGIVAAVAKNAAARARTPQRQIVRSSQAVGGDIGTVSGRGTDAEIISARATVGTLLRTEDPPGRSTTMYVKDKETGQKLPVMGDEDEEVSVPRNVETTTVLTRGIDYLGIDGAKGGAGNGFDPSGRLTIEKKLSGDIEGSGDDLDGITD